MGRKCVLILVLVVSYSYCHTVIETEGHTPADEDGIKPINPKKNVEYGGKAPVDVKVEASNGDQLWPTDYGRDTFPMKVDEKDKDKTIDARAIGRAKHWLQTREETLHMNSNGIVKEKNHTPLPWGDTRSIRTFISWPSIPPIPHIPDIEIPQSWKDAIGRKR